MYDVVVKKFTFAISPPDKFLLEIYERTDRPTDTLNAILCTPPGHLHCTTKTVKSVYGIRVMQKRKRQ